MTDDKKPSSMDDFESLLNAQFASYRKGYDPGERVKATVLEVGTANVILDVQAKREGLIPIAELRDEQGVVTVKAGQTLEVTFVGMQDGAFLFTTRHSFRAVVDQSIAQARSSGLPIEGTVQGEINGGYEVMIGGRRAFCPYSQISLFKQEGAEYIGKKFTFIVQENDGDDRNLVVSHRAVLEREREAQRAGTEQLKEVAARQAGSGERRRF